MTKEKVRKMQYAFENKFGLTYDTFSRAMKTKYTIYEKMLRYNSDLDKTVIELLKEDWNNITPLTDEEMLELRVVGDEYI